MTSEIGLNEASYAPCLADLETAARREQAAVMNRVEPLIIAGMPRSGTTMLRRLCDEHPRIWMTSELGNYGFIGDPLPQYIKRTATRLRQINGKWPIVGLVPDELPSTLMAKLRSRPKNHAINLRVVVGHLFQLARYGTGPVTLSALVMEARRSHPEARVVGDKFPRYVLQLDRLSKLPDLLRLVIYRDARDVTSSFLHRLRTDWKRSWPRDVGPAGKIARRWVRAIESMERNAEQVFAVRYEELVGDPTSEVKRLAEWLDVEPSGFDTRKVYATSVGKYKRGLTTQELDDVLKVAGPTLERLKYPLD